MATHSHTILLPADLNPTQSQICPAVERVSHNLDSYKCCIGAHEDQYVALIDVGLGHDGQSKMVLMFTLLKVLIGRLSLAFTP
jgi:hypothetical protein